MERLLASGVSAANSAQYELRVIANNLANANTVGFKADHVDVQASSDPRSGLESLNQPLTFGSYTDVSSGAFETTGRALDVAIENDNGWFSVTDAQGNLAYTRAGHLTLGADGVLLSRGQPIQGVGGDIVVAESRPLHINSAGDVLMQGDESAAMSLLDRLAMITVSPNQMAKGEDGFFRPTAAADINESPAINVRSGVLESSNVNAVEEMLRTVAVSRQFDLNVKMLSTADTLAQVGNELIRG